jgi:hypothetical protein
MCNPMIFMVAGAALSAASAINQGEQAAATGNYQNAQAQADAEAAKGEAELQARQIRDAGKRQKAAATAASAASGLSISDGTAELINNQIDQGSEQDALTSILNGKHNARTLQAQGEMSKISGDNARTAGYASAIGSVAKAASGWKTSASAAPTFKQSIHVGGY